VKDLPDPASREAKVKQIAEQDVYICDIVMKKSTFVNGADGRRRQCIDLPSDLEEMRRKDSSYGKSLLLRDLSRV